MSPRSTQNGGVLHPDAPISLRTGAKVTGIDPATKTVLVESTGHGGPLGAPTRDQPHPGAHDRNRSGAKAAGLSASATTSSSWPPTRATSLRKQVFCLRTGRCLGAPGTAPPSSTCGFATA